MKRRNQEEKAEEDEHKKKRGKTATFQKTRIRRKKGERKSGSKE